MIFCRAFEYKSTVSAACLFDILQQTRKIDRNALLMYLMYGVTVKSIELIRFILHLECVVLSLQESDELLRQLQKRHAFAAPIERYHDRLYNDKILDLFASFLCSLTRDNHMTRRASLLANIE